MIESLGELKEVLSFRLKNEWYLIEMNFIDEILPSTRISRFAKQAEFVSGMVNVSGSLILIVEIGMFLNLSKAEIKKDSRTVFLKTGNDITGFLADEVAETIKIDTATCQASIATIQGVEAEFIKGIFKGKEKHYIWLDIERVLLEIEMRLA